MILEKVFRREATDRGRSGGEPDLAMELSDLAMGSGGLQDQAGCAHEVSQLRTIWFALVFLNL